MVQELKRPMELAALKGRLERAQRVQAKIGQTGERLDKVLDQIEEKEAQASGHAGQLEQYNTALEATIADMIGGSNQPKKDVGPNGQGGGSSGDKTVTIEVTPGAGGGSGGAGGGNTNGAT